MSHIPEQLKQLYTVISDELLELHLLPTEQCNFRCVYCYEDFLLGKMKPNIVNAIKQLITKRMPNLKHLRISWFGGEPLAAKNIVFDLTRFSKEIAEANRCKFTSGMTTNGYLLTPEVFEKLIEVQVNAFQISLDGPEEVHNKTRLRADGAGTFSKIWENLAYMAKTSHEFEVILRVHITPQNYHDMVRLIELIKANFSGDKRFSIFLKAIANLGGPNAGNFEILTGKTKQEAMAHLQEFIKDAVQQHTLTKNPNQHYICYASAPNAMVIRSDGSLAKCTVAFNDDRNCVGKINDDGTLTIDHEKIQPWLRGLKNLDFNTMGCPLYGLPKVENKITAIPVVVQQT